MVSEISDHGSLAHALGQNILWQECVADEVLHLMVDRKQKETGQDQGPGITIKGMTPKTYLLKFPQPPKIGPPARNEAFNT
jgi:hypothetical protein